MEIRLEAKEWIKILKKYYCVEGIRGIKVRADSYETLPTIVIEFNK